MPNLLSRGGLLPGGVAAGIILSVVLLLGPALKPALSEDIPGLTNPCSPLVFPPIFRAEFAAVPIWYSLSSGKMTRAGTPHTWDLERVFNFPHSALFLDFMGRLQLGRFSLRAYYEPRDLSGERHFQGDPDAPMAQARYSCQGVRVGGDVDLAQWNLARVGVDVDYDILAPSFSEAIETAQGFKMTGKRPLTFGIHGVYNPQSMCLGVSPLFEFRARWPVAGTELTEVLLAAGLKAPETVLGSLALKTGYRHTVIEFSGPRSLDMTLDGWFSELVYFY